MSKRGGTIGARIDRWLDEWKMALSGIALASRSRKFVLTTVITFLVFGTLMNLLSSSSAALDLFWATDWIGKFSIIGDSFLATFGIGRSFWDWALNFFIVILQSFLIGLVVFVWQGKRRSKREQAQATAQNADNLQSAGLVAGLAVLGSGCPTCGTTLLMPILGTIFSSSSYALASTISGLLTFAAVLLALFTLKRIGKEAYAMILSDRYAKKHQPKSTTGKDQDGKSDANQE